MFREVRSASLVRVAVLAWVGAVALGCRGEEGRCEDDAFEPNDARISAAPYTPGAARVLCPDDLDVWSWVVSPGQEVRAHLRAAEPDGDVDLALVDGEGDLLATVRATAAGESASWANTQADAAEVFLQVSGSGGAYELDVEAAAAEVPDCPPEDAFEENDTVAAAVPVPAQVDAGTFRWDVDHYTWTPDPGEVVSIALSGPVVGVLSTPEGVALAHADANGRIRWQNPTVQPEPVVLRVEPEGVCAAYSLASEVSPPPREQCGSDGVDEDLDGFADCRDLECASQCSCAPPDPLEPNDTPAQASEYVDWNLTLHAQSPDYFAFVVEAGGRLDVEVSHGSGAHRDADLVLTDAAGVVLAEARTASTDETLSWTNTTGSTVSTALRVGLDGPQGTCTTYFPRVDLYQGGDDPHEPNEDFDTPLPLPQGAPLRVGTLQSPVDVWSLEVPPASAVEVTVEGVQFAGPGTIQVDLYRPGLDHVAADVFSDPDTRVLTAANPTSEAATFLLHVWVAYGDAVMDYEVEVRELTAVPEVCDDELDNDFDGLFDCEDEDCAYFFPYCGCPEDLHENNDTVATAVPLPVDPLWLVVFAQDPDFYQVDVPPTTRVVASLSYPGVGLVIRDGAGAQLAAGVGTWFEGPEAVWDNGSTSPASVVLHVTTPADAWACYVYELDVVFEPIDCPAEDALEPNDDSGTAFAEPTGSAMAVFERNEDWFSWQVEPGETIAVDVTYGHRPDGDVDLDLLVDGASVATSAGATGAEHVSWTNDTGASALALLRVHLDGAGTCAAYDLVATQTP